MNVAAGAEADDTLVHSFRPDRGPWGLRLRRSVSLIATPFVFGFASTSGIAVALPIVLGIGLIVYSLLTDYELGLRGLEACPDVDASDSRFCGRRIFDRCTVRIGLLK